MRTRCKWQTPARHLGQTASLAASVAKMQPLLLRLHPHLPPVPNPRGPPQPAHSHPLRPQRSLLFRLHQRLPPSRQSPPHPPVLPQPYRECQRQNQRWAFQLNPLLQLLPRCLQQNPQFPRLLPANFLPFHFHPSLLLLRRRLLHHRPG